MQGTCEPHVEAKLHSVTGNDPGVIEGVELGQVATTIVYPIDFLPSA